MTLKPKTIAFANKILAEPKISAQQAYLDTHKTENKTTAKSNAHQLLKKPEVQIYLQRHTEKAKKRIVELLDSEKDEVVLKAAVDVLDRTYGKSIQRQQIDNTNINLNIEASAELSDAFTAFLSGSTKQT